MDSGQHLLLGHPYCEPLLHDYGSHIVYIAVDLLKTFSCFKSRINEVSNNRAISLTGSLI